MFTYKHVRTSASCDEPSKTKMQSSSCGAARRLTVIKRHLICAMSASFSTKNEEVLARKVGERALFVTLNRPSKLNALSMEMIDGLNDVFKNTVLKGNGVDVLLLEGAGGKAFSAGGDVARVREAGINNEPLARTFFEEEYQLNHIIGTQTIAPQISVWDGITMGGGVGISVHGRYRVCTENTLFAKPETAIGFFPDVGGSFFLSHLDGGLGLFVGMTGARLNARDLLYCGVATHFIPSAALESLKEDLGMFQASPGGTTVGDLLERHSRPSPSRDGCKLGSNLEDNRDAIDRCFSGQASVADIVQALENENTDWSRSILKAMQPLSPMALKHTKKLIELAKGKDLAACLEIEFDLCQNIVNNKDSDFYEGVRAVLVDKDRNAQWPEGAALHDISDEAVTAKFEYIENRLNLSRNEG
jgi:3-hydroxyisobutyryl-CoA hydrolase